MTPPVHDAALRSGNTLVIKDNVKVASLSNFENYEFHMQNSSDSAMLESTGTLHLGDNANLRIYVGNKADNLLGEKINVYKGADPIGGNFGTTVALQGISIVNHLTYDTASIASGSHFFTVTSVSANPLTIAFPDSRLASFSFMNKASDLMFGEGVASAISATATKPSEWAFFGLISGVYSGYDTKIDETTGRTTFAGPSFILGGANTTSVGNGSILASLYFETGIGFIDSQIDTVYGSVNTEGNANYYGGGALIRYAMNSGFYTEGFMRLGTLESKMESLAQNENIQNDFMSMYFGAGVNLGYEIDLFDSRDILDVYTRYTWGHLTGTDAKLDDQDYKFDNINSHQVSVGIRYIFIEESVFSPYLGMPAKYEFDAKSSATIRGEFEIASTSLKGFTGVPEIGLRLTPSETVDLTMALNFAGHFGKTEGFDTSFDIEYSF